MTDTRRDSVEGDTGGWRSEPVFFPAGGERLFGVFTAPSGDAHGTAVTMLTGGGYITSTHRNRLYVRLARRLAGLGYHSMRFDYRGTGESTGTIDGFLLDQPFVEDVLGAVEWVEGQGVVRHVLVGSCFGARTALAAADHVSGLDSAVLLSAPVRDIRYEKMTEEPVSEHFVNQFRSLSSRGVPTLLVYGREERSFRDLHTGELRHLVEGSDRCVDLEALPGRVHQFGSVAVQDAVLDLVVRWLGARGDRRREGAPA